MITALPSLCFRPFTFLTLAVSLLYSSTGNNLIAQTSGNLLINGSFESPAVASYNSNNIIGPGIPWGGWNCTNGGFNILRMSGTGYGSGASLADDGEQYMDVANTDGYISQQFVLDHVSPLSFSGAFSSRESGWSGYVAWTSRVEILDSTGAVVASSTTRDFVTTDNKDVWYTMTGTTVNLQPGTYTYRAYAGNWGHFDNAMVFALNPVLSVKLFSFNAAAQGSEVLTTWNVSTEQKLKGYELQWGTDGIHFQPAGFVAAGNKSNYSMLHRHPSSGIVYYRLKVIDLDGSFFYSRLRTISFSETRSAALYPNPATGVVYLRVDASIAAKPATVQVIGATGQVVFQKIVARLNVNEMIDISSLTAGTYYTKLVADGQTITRPLQVLSR